MEFLCLPVFLKFSQFLITFFIIPSSVFPDLSALFSRVFRYVLLRFSRTYTIFLKTFPFFSIFRYCYLFFSRFFLIFCSYFCLFLSLSFSTFLKKKSPIFLLFHFVFESVFVIFLPPHFSRFFLILFHSRLPQIFAILGPFFQFFITFLSLEFSHVFFPPFSLIFFAFFTSPFFSIFFFAFPFSKNFCNFLPLFLDFCHF